MIGPLDHRTIGPLILQKNRLIDRDRKILCQRYDPRLFSNSIAWTLMKQSWNWLKFLDMDLIHNLQKHGVQMDSKFFITGRINSARQNDGSELIFPKLKHGGKLIIVPMDISKFPDFPQWVGFFESMDDFADKGRLSLFHSIGEKELYIGLFSITV